MKSAFYKVSRLISADMDSEDSSHYQWSGVGLSVRSHLGMYPPQPLAEGEEIRSENSQVLYVTKGDADFVVNLQERHLGEGQLLVFTKETIFRMKRRSEDFDMLAIYVSDDMMSEVMLGRIPPLFMLNMRDYLLSPDEKEQTLLRMMTEGLCLSFSTGLYRTRGQLLAGILHMVHELIIRVNARFTDQHARNVKVLNKFLELIGEHCDTHRDLDFYAREMCLNKQYLSSIISETTKRTTNQWIEEAAVTRIKVLLRHTTNSMQEISEIMHFPEPSHLSRYFKRVTGMTPSEYRQWE